MFGRQSKNGTREPQDRFLDMLLGFFAASFLENVFTDKRVKVRYQEEW